jgi:hypothetical protein
VHFNLFDTPSTKLIILLLQKEAAQQVAGKQDIIRAAKVGNCNLIVAHLLSNASSVHQRDER